MKVKVIRGWFGCLGNAKINVVLLSEDSAFPPARQHSEPVHLLSSHKLVEHSYPLSHPVSTSSCIIGKSCMLKAWGPLPRLNCLNVLFSKGGNIVFCQWTFLSLLCCMSYACSCLSRLSWAARKFLMIFLHCCLISYPFLYCCFEIYTVRCKCLAFSQFTFLGVTKEKKKENNK